MTLNIMIYSVNYAEIIFFLEHRKEERGVGGIFFDYLQKTG